MTIDFFVHPQHLETKGIYKYPKIMKSYGKYFQHLLYNLETSNLPILIKGRGDTFFEMEIPSENQFSSNNCGEISSSEEWEKFTKLLKGREPDEMKINGSYFGQCARNFALQLFTYLKTGENLFPEDDFDGLSRVKTQRECQHFGDFARSNIKYGVVLHYHKNKSILKEFISFNKSPFGNVNRQLVDSQTRIYF